MQDSIEEWMKMINSNKEKYSEKIKNTNILHLRQKAAESGIEMTPNEVEYYMDFIKKLTQ